MAKNNSEISQFYRKRLLIPGWAGELDSTELAYSKKELLADRRLRAKWGFKRGTGRLSEEKIKYVALHGVDGLQEALSEDLEGVEHEWLDFENVLADGLDTEGQTEWVNRADSRTNGQDA
ncbi:MAG: hypothetical protein HQ553_12495 [Chloroflexi bacterium]|nr:hypothetical protein [Chloroflexota bacterium]